MSTRFPSHVNVPRSEEFHSPSAGRKAFRLGFSDIVFFAMVLIAVVGLAYEWLR